MLLLGNDEDPDDDLLAVTSHDDPPAGMGTIECSGDCTYTPPTTGPATGQFTINYTIGDGRGGFASSTATIRLVEDAGPTAVDDFGTARFGKGTDIDVLANDYDPGDRLTVVLVTGAERGSARVRSTAAPTSPRPATAAMTRSRTA